MSVPVVIPLFPNPCSQGHAGLAWIMNVPNWGELTLDVANTKLGWKQSRCNVTFGGHTNFSFEMCVMKDHYYRCWHVMVLKIPFSETSWMLKVDLVHGSLISIAWQQSEQDWWLYSGLFSAAACREWPLVPLFPTFLTSLLSCRCFSV